MQDLVSKHIPEKAYAEQWDTKTLQAAISGIFDLDLPIPEWAAKKVLPIRRIQERLIEAVDKRAAKKEAELGQIFTARSKRKFCCARSTVCGASTSYRSNTCVR